MHLQRIGVFAQRFRLKTVVELLQFRQLRAVWRRRGAAFFFLLLWKEIHRRRGGFLSVHHQRCNHSALEKISPYLFIAISVKCSQISRRGKVLACNKENANDGPEPMLAISRERQSRLRQDTIETGIVPKVIPDRIQFQIAMGKSKRQLHHFA